MPQMLHEILEARPLRRKKQLYGLVVVAPYAEKPFCLLPTAREGLNALRRATAKLRKPAIADIPQLLMIQACT